MRHPTNRRPHQTASSKAPFAKSLFALTTLATLTACAAETNDTETVANDTHIQTSFGPIEGLEVDGVMEFRGVRYAKPPLANLRFQPPSPLDVSTETADATQYGQACTQLRAGAGAAAYPPLVQAAMNEAFVPPENVKPEGDEDCLVLNVYSQASGPNADANRPVMVWLHGGGFSYGQAPLNIYRGHNLAKNHDVVFVGVNHRLNAFGYIGLDSAGIPGFEDSSNAGMLDIIAALNWVKDNIDQFGGDPNNVTIFGQSGGGAKVSTLLAMPEANGLFTKAIIQSGAGIRAGTSERAATAANDFLAKLNLTPENAAAQLAEIPASDILQAAIETGGRNFRPSLDEHLPDHPFDPGAPAQSADIPIMIGYTKDEQTLYTVGNPDWVNTTEADVLAAAERIAPGQGQTIVDTFKAAFPDYAPHHLLMQVGGGINSLRSHHTLASRKAEQNAAVYAYMFTHDIPPQDFILKSPHTAEIPYIMDNVAQAPLFAGATDEDKAMGELMSRIWVNFAKTGNPNVEGLPEWPTFNADTRPTMYLQNDAHVVEQPFQPIWEILLANPTPNAPPI